MKKDQKPPNGERFIQMPRPMILCRAFKTLPGGALKVLVDIWSWNWRNGTPNNGKIAYGVRQAEELGIGHSAAAAHIAELVDRGFLKIREDAAFGTKRRVRRFEITGLECDGKEPTHDYLNWTQKRRRKKSHSPLSRTVAKLQSAQPDCSAENVIFMPNTRPP